MSLTSFIDQREITVLLDRVSKQTVVDSKPIKLSPSTKDASLLGTAFDYLLRFEIQRLSPCCETRSWTAEHATTSLDPTGVYLVPPGYDPHDRDAIIKLHETAQVMLSSAKFRQAEYIHQKERTPVFLNSIAEAVLGLAQLDVRGRTGRIPLNFGSVDNTDIAELVSLIQLVPDELLRCNDPVYLNPTFGNSSLLVGGADADILLGNALIEIKTVKDFQGKRNCVRQLLGYYLLARRYRLENPSFPEIKEVGIYFSRHAYLWKMPVTQWTDHPDFLEVERRFFELAQEKFK